MCRSIIAELQWNNIWKQVEAAPVIDGHSLCDVRLVPSVTTSTLHHSLCQFQQPIKVNIYDGSAVSSYLQTAAEHGLQKKIL